LCCKKILRNDDGHGFVQVLDLLAASCPALTIRRRVCERLVREGVIDESWRFCESMVVFGLPV
jgi:hypothetical protein